MSDPKEKSVNQVTLSGILSEVIVRKTGNGDPVANASLEVIDAWDGERPRRQFLRLVLWRGLGTKAAELPKAAKVRITGRLETASWQDKETGEKKYRLQIVAHSLEPIERLQDIPPSPLRITPAQVANALTPQYPAKADTRKVTGQQIAEAILRKSTAITKGNPITDADIPF